MTNANIIEDLTLVPLPQWWQSPWVIAAGLLAAGVVVWLLAKFLRRPGRPQAAAPVPVGPPPHEDALRRLAALRSRMDSLSGYQLAIDVSDILRDYMSARFQLPIRYQTTREFLDAAATNPVLEVAQREEVAVFLGFCDLVKFAQRPANPSEQSGLLDTAEAFIRKAAQRSDAPNP